MKLMKTSIMALFVPLALLAMLGLVVGTTDFEQAEKRAVECCAKIDSPLAYVCTLGAANANMKLGYETLKTAGLIGPNGVSAEQKETMKAFVKVGLPSLRRLGVTNSTGCITQWLDHSDCCRDAGIPSACLHVCDYSKLEGFYNNEDVDAIVARNIDIFGQCHPHVNAMNKCSYAE